MPAPDRIKQLVETFEQNINEYHSRKNETELRRQFLDPFFEALGWDVDNKKGYDERNKEVAHEHSVEIDGQQKKADYAFRTGKDSFDFLVEAKKPSVRVENNLDAAFQIRSYGWSARLPINILTDFEHFVIYDCRTRPNYSKDKAKTGQIEVIHYKEYSERWDEIAGLFSPEAIRKGALDKFKDSLKSKKGTQEVDDAFLEEIEEWRKILAQNIALRNKGLNLDEDQINFAVQMLIDRIIFLRIAEERGMEKYRRLFEISEEDGIYNNLLKIFKQADARYNSGLFHFKKDGDREKPDTLTPQLEIDDKVLKDIIKDLYHPSSYAFNYIPTEILGSIYERFLGKVIRLTAGGNARVDEKPEVRKAGGVYYTPAYIVEYIVKNTVGKLVEDKTPAEVSQLKIVDPACGSGSFLLGAYQYLLDWHLNWYTSHSPENYVARNDGKKKGDKKEIKPLVTADQKTYILSIDEKKRILLNNIYGVDLDPQAVEVTKLSLLLKVVEDPGQLKMFDEGHILPNLNKNIKNGNALIGTDYFSGQMFGNIEEMKHVKPFDWQDEFPEVFRHGGFDAVIGNPPYLRIQGLQENYEKQIEYFAVKYISAVKRFDLYLLFIERAFQLLRKDGLHGFICPHKFINSDFGSGLRQFLLSNQALDKMISFGNNLIFDQASTYTGLLFLSKKQTNNFKYYEFQDTKKQELAKNLFSLKDVDFTNYLVDTFSNKPWILTHQSTKTILERLNQPQNLEGVCDSIFQGVVTGIDEVYFLERIEGNQSDKELVNVYSERMGKIIEIEKDILKPMLKGEDISRYKSPEFKNYCIYPYQLTSGKTNILEENDFAKKYPRAYEYLLNYRTELRDLRVKFKTNPKYWYSCHRARSIELFETVRIITPEISLGCNMTIAPAGLYHNTKVYSIIPLRSQQEKQNYWLGLLNSKIMWWFLSNTGYVLRGGYFVFKTNYLNPFPARTINFNDATEKSMHDKMVTLVEQMLSLHKALATAKDQERELIQRQITSTDRMIDELVYQLYGLSEEEIKIVEGDKK